MTDHIDFTSHADPLPATVRILVLARAVNRLGAFALPFLGVVLTTEFGTSLAGAGLVLTVFGLATIPSRLLGGQLADRLGRKPTILIGLLGCALAQLGIALAPTLPAVIVAVAVLGLAFEIYEPPSQAMIADLTGEANRPAAYGLLSTALAVAAVAAGLIAAAVSAIGLRWLFVIDAVSCLACALLIAAAIPGQRSTRATADRDTRIWRDHRLLLMLATGTVFAVLYLQLTSVLPLTLISRGLEPSDTGILLAVAAAALLVAQPLLRRWTVDHFTALTIGYGVLALGLGLNGVVTTLPGFLVAAVVCSVADLLLIGRSFTIVSALAPTAVRGRYLAAYGVSWGIAAAVGPLAGTSLLAATGPLGLWTACAVTAGLLAVVQPGLRRRIGVPGWQRAARSA